MSDLSMIPQPPIQTLMRAPSFVAVAIAVFPFVSHAQNAVTLAAETRVRASGLEVTDRGERLYRVEGSIAGGDSSRLVLRVDGRTRPDTLPYFMMHRLDVRQGQTSRRKLVLGGLAIGGAAGLALWGITMVVPTAEKSSSTTIGPDGTPHVVTERETGNRRVALLSIPVLSLTGLTIGALMSNDNWVPVSIPGVRATNAR
jgi:hypothetical protein